MKNPGIVGLPTVLVSAFFLVGTAYGLTHLADLQSGDAYKVVIIAFVTLAVAIFSLRIKLGQLGEIDPPGTAGSVVTNEPGEAPVGHALESGSEQLSVMASEPLAHAADLLERGCCEKLAVLDAMGVKIGHITASTLLKVYRQYQKDRR